MATCRRAAYTPNDVGSVWVSDRLGMPFRQIDADSILWLRGQRHTLSGSAESLVDREPTSSIGTRAQRNGDFVLLRFAERAPQPCHRTTHPPGRHRSSCGPM